MMCTCIGNIKGVNIQGENIGHDGIERQILQLPFNSMDMVWGCQIFSVEVSYLLWGIINILQVFPSIILDSIAIPLNEVLESLSEHPTVQNPFHDIFLFTINKFQRRGQVLTSSRNQVL